MYLNTEKVMERAKILESKRSAKLMNQTISSCRRRTHHNTCIQNVKKEDALPKFDRDDFCFYLINKKEESSKVSSVVSVSKPDYVEKMPFKSLPPNEESKKSKKKKKKKKKRSKRREEMVSSPKHVAPIIDYDNSDLDDVLMPVTYVSDHDWESTLLLILKIFLVPIDMSPTYP
jgi:hypothetical protein